MRAAVIRPDGSIGREEIEPPRPGEGEVAVIVTTAGLNPIDLLTAAGEVAKGAGLVVGGREGVGLVDERRHYFGATVRPSGSLGEVAVVAGERLVALPDEVDDAAAISLGVAGQAAWLGLEWRAKLQPGEHVLVLGAGGTVGILAVQIARLLGAGRVIAGARSDSGRRRASEVGADATVDLGGEDVAAIAERLAEASKGRVDVVLDALWGPPAQAALDVASPGARLVQLGSAAAAAVQFNPAPLRRRLVDLLAFSSGSVPNAARLDAYRRSLEYAARGELAAPAREVPFDRVEQAWDEQRRGPGAKLVVRVR